MSSNFRIATLARAAAIAMAVVLPGVSGAATSAFAYDPSGGDPAVEIQADVPGYLFQDFGQHSSANASGITARAATDAPNDASVPQSDAQIAAANRKADQALATARQALREAQQAKQQQSMQQAMHQQPMQQAR